MHRAKLRVFVPCPCFWQGEDIHKNIKGVDSLCLAMIEQFLRDAGVLPGVFLSLSGRLGPAKYSED